MVMKLLWNWLFVIFEGNMGYCFWDMYVILLSERLLKKYLRKLRKRLKLLMRLR